MKKMLLISQHVLITGCAQQTFTVQNKWRAPQRNHRIISSFLELGRRKLSMQQKICGGAENVVKNRNPANIRKWIARFITLGIYTPLEARVYCSQ